MIKSKKYFVGVDALIDPAKKLRFYKSFRRFRNIFIRTAVGIGPDGFLKMN